MCAQHIQGRTRRKGIRSAALAVLFLLIVALAPALAHAQGAGSDTLSLVWTAPGDDGSVGRASSYEVRMSTAAISDVNWSSAAVVPGVPTPAISGTRQKVVVRGLTRGTSYFFALKSTDDAGNVSGISNLLRWDWVFDTAPPATPSGVTAAKSGANVHLHWNANSEADLSGYKVYRGLAAGGPWTVINAPLSVTNDYTDTSVPVADAVWYRVSAVDNSANESGRSNALMVLLTGSSATTDTWHLDAPYPNPAGGSTTMNLPMYLQSTGAQLQIVDASRHVVRQLDLSAFAPGQRTVTWDGLNDAGRPVAPGVYTAWLIAGGTQSSVRLVRVP